MPYPDEFDAVQTNKTNSTNQKDDHPAHHNALGGAVNRTQETLGINPQGEYEDVAERLQTIEDEAGGGGGGSSAPAAIDGDTAVNAGSVTLVDDPPPGTLRGFIAIDAFTTSCELRLVTNVVGKVLTVERNLSLAHLDGAKVIFYPLGQDSIPVGLFGALGDGSDDEPALQQAILECYQYGVWLDGSSSFYSGSAKEYTISRPLMWMTGVRARNITCAPKSDYGPYDPPTGRTNTAMAIGCTGKTTFTADSATDLITTPSAHGLATNNSVVLKGNIPGGTKIGWAYRIINTGSTTFALRDDTGISVTPDHTTETFTAVGHGLTDGTPVTFVTPKEQLPSGLSYNVTYWVINATADTFQVSATSGGAVKTITSNGTNVKVHKPLNLTSNVASGGILYTGAVAFQRLWWENMLMRGARFGDSSQALSTATIASADATTDVITTDAAHGLSMWDQVMFSGSVPAGLTVGVVYYVSLIPSSTTFKVITKPRGSNANITATGTGTVHIKPGKISGAIFKLQQPGSMKQCRFSECNGSGLTMVGQQYAMEDMMFFYNGIGFVADGMQFLYGESGFNVEGSKTCIKVPASGTHWTEYNNTSGLSRSYFHGFHIENQPESGEDMSLFKAVDVEGAFEFVEFSNNQLSVGGGSGSGQTILHVHNGTQAGTSYRFDGGTITDDDAIFINDETVGSSGITLLAKYVSRFPLRIERVPRGSTSASVPLGQADPREASNVQLFADGTVLVLGGGHEENPIMAVYYPAARTGDIYAVRDITTGNSVWAVDGDGYMYIAKNSAPSDSRVSAGEIFFWTDSTAGTLNYKGKTSGGTVFTGVVVPAATLAASGKGFVNHGATAGTARPTGYASVEWVGSVEPTNAVNGDTWVNTA